MKLLNLPTIAGAISTTTTTPIPLQAGARNLLVQANFGYGSGGTTVDAYVQTSVDGGVTWIDIAQFHFTTSAVRSAYNLNGQTTVATAHAATDGSLSANTAVDGILGSQLRVKYASTGTYAGATSLQIDATTDQVQ